MTTSPAHPRPAAGAEESTLPATVNGAARHQLGAAPAGPPRRWPPISMPGHQLDGGVDGIASRSGYWVVTPQTRTDLGDDQPAPA